MGINQFWGRVTLALGCGLTLAACAHGGGRNASVVTPLALPPAATDTPYIYSSGDDTGSMGVIAAPTAAVWGSAPPQIAIVGGATISGGSQPYSASGAIFPVLARGLQFSATSVSPVPIGNDATATVIEPDYYDPCFGGEYTTLQLAITSANVKTTISVYHFVPANGRPDALNYVALGWWFSGSISNGLSQAGPTGEFLFGYETPLPAMPTTGQATYSGSFSGDVYAPINGHVMEAGLNGKASLSADFASGTVTGALTGIRYEGGTTSATVSQPAQHITGPWNDVSVNAAIAAGSNRFSGTTAVTSAPQNPFSLAASATGHIDGAFFGPTAQAIGALWTLSDGNAAAVGGVTGAH